MSNEYTDKGLNNNLWILGKIHNESKDQLEKWGIQAHSAFEWLTYTTEELGELAKAICDHEYRGDAGTWSRTKVVIEAIQVATLALKIAEMFEEVPDAEPKLILGSRGEAVTITKERIKQIVEKYVPCHCDPAYKDRGLVAPDCPRCSFYVEARRDVYGALLSDLHRRMKN